MKQEDLGELVTVIVVFALMAMWLIFHVVKEAWGG